MKPTDGQYELIDQYLQGELSGEELTKLEMLIANDPEFAEAVETEKILIAAIKRSAREEMKKKLIEFDLAKVPAAKHMRGDFSQHSYMGREFSNHSESNESSRSIIWFLAAASVLLFSGLGIYFLIENNNIISPDNKLVLVPPIKTTFNLPVKTVGIQDTSLGYVVSDGDTAELERLPILLISDEKPTRHYQLTDTLTLSGIFPTDGSAFELIRINENEFTQLYLKMDNQFYPLSETREFALLKAETDERMIEQLKTLLKPVQKDAGE
ncbi:MAG: hypothetical protein IPM47_03315 [Sphingobacteriales bacterium]|nr:MAG: hypothetical protein IPM47_03315 [Sphingobacteriales bacterium]